MSRSMVATIVLFFSSLLWGMSWMPLRGLSAMGVDSLQLIVIAYCGLFLISLPFVLRYRNMLFENYKPLLCIFVAGGTANACFNYALIHGVVLRVMALFYLLPVWGVIGGKFILKERTGFWRWFGVFAAVTGAMILLDVKNIFAKPPSWIDLVALMSGFFFAATILLFRGVSHVPLIVKMNALFLGCSFIAVIALLVLMKGAQQFPSVLNIFWVLAFAFGWLLWSNFGSQWAATQLPAGRTSIIMVMELVAAAVSAVYIGGEVFTQALIIGGALILSATAIEIVQAFNETPAQNA